MKPKILKIEGLNSFQEQQTIDFSRLMERGLFGIFGATGSGKSTILDAITLSLYGDIPRNSKEFINSDSKLLMVYFEFELNFNKIYVVERNYERKKDGSCNHKNSRIYEKYSDGKIDIIAEGDRAVTKQSEELIGLSADDFERTVVLPQGKFSEFLTLTASKRSDMLERILHLEEYGRKLEEKIKSENKKVKNELNLLDSKIEVYEGLTKESLAQEKTGKQLLTDAIEKLKREQFEIQTELNSTEEVWKLQKEKLTYENQYNELLKDKEKIELKKQILITAQKADIIYPHIKTLEDTQKNLYNINTELDFNIIQDEKISKQLEERQINYNQAKAIKDMQYEILLKKEANLKQSIDISRKVKQLEQNKEILQNEYNEYSQKYKCFKEQEIKIDENINKYKLNLETTINQKENLKTNYEFKQELEKAYECENKYNELKIVIAEISDKITQYIVLIKESEEQKLNLIEQLKNLDQEISLLESQLNNINKSDYKNPNILLMLQHKCTEVSSEYKYIKEREEKKSILEAELKELIKSKNQYEHEHIFETQQEQKYSDTIKQYQSQIKALQIISKASILAEVLKDGEPCPVCGSTNHPHLASLLESDILLNIQEKLEETQIFCINSQNNINKLSADIIFNNKQIEKINEQLSDISLELGEKSSEQIKQKEKELKYSFEQFKQKVEQQTEEENVLQKSLKEKKEYENKLNLDNTRILERQSKDIQTRQELNEQMHKYQIQYKYISENLSLFIQNLDIVDFKNEREKILLDEKEYSELEKIEKQLRYEINFHEQQKNEITNKIISIGKRVSELIQIIKEKTINIDNYNSDIKILSENNIADKYIVEVRTMIEKICKTEKDFYNQLENIKLEKQKLVNICESLKKQKEIFLKLELAQNNELKQIMKENELFEIQYIKNLLVSKEEQNIILTVVSQYEKEFKTVTDNLERLEKRLDGRLVKPQQCENLNIKISQIKQQLEKDNQHIAVIAERISIMDKDLKQLYRLEENRNKLLHQFDLLQELTRLIKANEFVKFVSKRQMKYITKEASTYLRKITKDRYSIEMDNNDDFIMLDNFSGGIRRKPDTLSGGEVFVTSLSLSLALSSQIQLKNKAPLEFFFLDEGFGSLDMQLLEVVIGALEKLHSEHMHIGIISHVEELKERIPIKLIVTSAQQGLHGSKIKLE